MAELQEEVVASLKSTLTRLLESSDGEEVTTIVRGLLNAPPLRSQFILLDDAHLRDLLRGGLAHPYTAVQMLAMVYVFLAISFLKSSVTHNLIGLQTGTDLISMNAARWKMS